MGLKGLKIGLAMCGSFCCFNEVIEQIKEMSADGADLLPIMSPNAFSIDSRFGKSDNFRNEISGITGKEIISSIKAAEPIGPKNMVDIIAIAPCTGNTLAKLANGIVDSSVLMAVKGHIRNNKPVVIAISSNDALGINLENIGKLINTKNLFFVPFGQDDYKNKPKSLIAKFHLLPYTIELALEGKQIQPILAID